MNNSRNSKKTHKRWKGCLWLSLGVSYVVISIIIISVIRILNSWGERREQAVKDRIELSAICDSIEYITERPMLKFYQFNNDEVEELKFWILRNGKLLNDTIVNRTCFPETDQFYVEIPYNEFIKTDTIVLMTKTPLYFYISGYHHQVYLHYGMFGYLGTSDCRLSETCSVNGNNYNGFINKNEGWTELPM